MLNPSVNCRSPPSVVHLRDRAATWEKPGDTVTWLHKVSLCYNSRHVSPNDGFPAKAPRMFSWGFTASKWDIQFFLSMVSILGLHRYFYILAKSPDCIICYCRYKWMNLCKPWTFYTWLEPTCAHKSLAIRNDSNTLGMVLTPVTPAFGSRGRRILSSRSVWNRLRPSSRDQVGAWQTKDL